MNSFAWIIWLIATLGALSATRNPLHLSLILLILVCMMKISRGGSKTGIPYLVSVFPLLLIMILTTTIFNTLISHVGTTTLLTIPGQITLLSGPITLEAIVYGATNGLVLSGILLAFSIFNQSISVKSIIRMFPKAFYPLALIISIAINFLPIIRRRIEEIRQAQAIRGHQMRHFKDYAFLFLPLLIDSLERSMQLAEAMTARGFVPHNPHWGTINYRLVILGGLVFFMSGWIIQLITGNQYAFGMSLAGVAIILFWYWWISRKIPQSVYKRENWHLHDWIVSGIVMVTLFVYIFPFPFVDHQILLYNPYPKITLPEFDVVIGCVSLYLFTPVLIQKKASV